MLKDYLREHSWTFRETLAESRVEDIEIVVEARFPALLASVKSRIASMTDLEKLQSFLLTTVLAKTEEEVTKALDTL